MKTVTQSATYQKMYKLTPKGGFQKIVEFLGAVVEYRLKRDIFCQSSDETLPQLRQKLDLYQSMLDQELFQQNSDRQRVEEMTQYLQRLEEA